MSVWHVWLWSVGLIAVAVVAALVVHRVAFGLLDRFTRHTNVTWDNSVVRHSRRPAGLALPLLATLIVMPYAPMDAGVRDSIGHLIAVGVVVCGAWCVIALVGVVEDVVRAKYPTDLPDNLEARRISTQIQVLRRVVGVVVSIVALAIALMTFPAIRHIGASLLASAGLAGLVVGMAMRPTLSNLLAGIQIALTQPIRLQDVVIVEGEWGWIEEITTTYVVVKCWDLRRMVLPLSYFVEKPFQNWTRTTAMLLGSVCLYTDYSVSVDEMRAELKRILKGTDLWMGNVCVLQVTDASEQTLELRALVDAKDSDAAWDLRCLIREKLIAYLREHHPQTLPRTRVELASPEPSA